MHPHRRAVASVPLIVLIAAAVTLVAVEGPFRRATARAQQPASAELSPFELERRNQSAFARLLGDFRASAADVMFVKTERYLHGGMSWQPHLDTTQMAASGVVVDKNVNINSEILVEEIDFRGPLGDIERAVKPFDLAHRHTDTTELLPWYRLMTVMDPHYVRGYRVGMYWLMGMTEQESWEEALAFIDEGIAKNDGAPEEFRLWTSRTLYFQKRAAKARTESAIPGDDETKLLEEALRSARNAFELGLKERPADGAIDTLGPRTLWTVDMEEDFLFGARYVCSLQRRLGRLDEAMADIRRIRKIVPNDNPLRSLEASVERELQTPAELRAIPGVELP